MSTYAATITSDNLLLILEGETRCFPADHPCYSKLVTEITRQQEAREINTDNLRALLDIEQIIQVYSEGDLIIFSDNSMKHKDRLLPESIAARVLECINEGIPYQNLLKFFELCNKNPRQEAIAELFKFINQKGMPITPNGTVLGYKGVNEDYTDRHSGKFCNKPGTLVHMNREDCCADPNRGCAPGLHVGSLKYANNWGDRVVVVEFSPEDVVSVPLREAEDKLRCCEYRVLSDAKGLMRDAAVTSLEDEDTWYEDEDEDEEDDFSILFAEPE